MKTYIKKNHKYWLAKKLNKHSMKFWYFLIACMALVTVWAVINRQVNKGGLVDPRVSHVVTQVMASETISCENPKGYLACKAYQGKITWEEHDRIAKVINCESRWNPEAININKNGTIDTGLVQRNSIHNKTLSTKDSFDYKKSIDWMINKMHKDGGLNAWVCNRLVK